MLSLKLNWIFYVTLAYGVVLIALAAYVIALIIQEQKVADMDADEAIKTAEKKAERKSKK